MTSFWMGNGAVMPRFVSAPTTGRDTPRSAKDMWCNSFVSGGNPETRTHSECTERRNSSGQTVAPDANDGSRVGGAAITATSHLSPETAC